MISFKKKEKISYTVFINIYNSVRFKETFDVISEVN